MNHETQVEALERRVRYAAAHPIEGLLTTDQLRKIRESVDAEPEEDSIDAALIRLLLGHIDALERHRPMAPYEREVNP